MPGYELIGKEELANLTNIFEESNGVLFPHGFGGLRNDRYRVREFEAAFAKKMGVKHAAAVTSGTVAQIVAMYAMGVKAGDEVITQAHTFVATVETIIAIGAVPVIVDVDDSFNMDPLKLEKAITSKTKLIIPVHMLGNPAKMDQIIAIANNHDIQVLEDSCEALGASYKGIWAGCVGKVGVYSLDFGKTITTGEGGMIVTNDDAIKKFCSEYTDHGHESNPNVPRGRDTRTMPGLNYRMNEMQGAVGLAQLEKLDYIVEQNKKNKHALKSNIKSDKIKFREITDENELSDTLIFSFDNPEICRRFLDKYTAMGYATKNIPDAVDWHFSGTWNHMFNDVPQYRDTWSTDWQHTRELIARSISLPVSVKSTIEEMEKHAQDINDILVSI